MGGTGLLVDCGFMWEDGSAEGCGFMWEDESAVQSIVTGWFRARASWVYNKLVDLDYVLNPIMRVDCLKGRGEGFVVIVHRSSFSYLGSISPIHTAARTLGLCRILAYPTMTAPTI